MRRKDCNQANLDWNIVLQRPATGGKGKTVDELCDELGMSRSYIQAKLKLAVKEGKVRFAGKRRVMRMDGVPALVPEYQPVES